MQNDKALIPVEAEVVTIEPVESRFSTIGQAANYAASDNAASDYSTRRTANTLRRQRGDVDLFKRYIAEVEALAGVAPAQSYQSLYGDLQILSKQEIDGQAMTTLTGDLSSWAGVTWGLVEGFNRWQRNEGYAIGSINVRLATMKVYAQLAMRAGAISSTEYALIKTVKGYRLAEGRNVDAKRAKTRRDGSKKAAPVSISPAHATLLKKRPDTKRGRRDALLMCLLLDQGLRNGEVADINTRDFDLSTGRLVFYRQKVHLTQEHNLTPDTLLAAQRYLSDLPAEQEALFLGYCSKNRVNERSLNHRVEVLGDSVGLSGLSPHDCRHFWATDAIRNGTDIKSLQDAGGWSSPAMPLRYAESAKVANAGVKLTATKKAL
jgi:integrase